MASDHELDFPTPSSEERDALRQIKAREIDMARITRLLAALPRPSYEALRARPLLTGEPFSLGSEVDSVAD